MASILVYSSNHDLRLFPNRCLHAAPPIERLPLPDRLAWFECLVSSKGDKYPCLPLAIPLGPIEPELWAVVLMLVVSLLSLHRTALNLAYVLVFS